MAANSFEQGEQKVIPAVLVYVESDGDILMLHRADRSGDIHSGKWNGLGGKMEKNESALEAAQRELREESGLDLPLQNFQSRGVLHFPNFKAHKCEDWMVFLFWVSGPSQIRHHSLKKIDEGQPHWVPKSQVLSLNLWPGDKIFLPHLLAGKKISGCFWYEKGEVKKSWIESL